MKIALNIPDNFLLFSNSKKLEKDMKLNHALVLFMRGEISISMAAELSDISIYDFIFQCNKNNIPVYNTSPEDLEDELKSIDINDFNS